MVTANTQVEQQPPLTHTKISFHVHMPTRDDKKDAILEVYIQKGCVDETKYVFCGIKGERGDLNTEEFKSIEVEINALAAKIETILQANGKVSAGITKLLPAGKYEAMIAAQDLSNRKATQAQIAVNAVLNVDPDATEALAMAQAAADAATTAATIAQADADAAVTAFNTAVTEFESLV